VCRHAKDLGIPMVCCRVWCILMSAAVVDHEDELKALLDRPPLRRSEPLSKWFEDRKLSSELVIRSDHKIVILPRSAWVMGSDDAPTRIGALMQRGAHVAHIYEGGQPDSLLQRPRRMSNKLRGFGIYRYQGRYYVPEVAGIGKAMGVSAETYGGLTANDQVLALGNVVPMDMVAAILRSVFSVIKAHPEISARTEAIEPLHWHIREVVQQEQRRICQREYESPYPSAGAAEVGVYRGVPVPRLSLTIVGGSGLTGRIMTETKLFLPATHVGREGEAALTKALLGTGTEDWPATRAGEINSEVVIGCVGNLSQGTMSLYEQVVRGKWLVLQVRMIGTRGCSFREWHAWVSKLCLAKGNECALSTSKIESGGYGDTISTTIFVGTLTLGVVAKVRGSARVAEGHDTPGHLISHLVSPSVIIKNSPHGTRIRKLARTAPPPVRVQPLVHGHDKDGRPVYDPSGPVSDPAEALVGDGRLELKSTNKAFARELMVSEVLSLYGVTSPEVIRGVTDLRLEGRLARALVSDSPPLVCRAVALRIHQHLVPIVQESAKRSLHGCATSTRGSVASTNEACRIHAAGTDGLDVVLLGEHLAFTHGTRTLEVPEGTSVRVLMDRGPRERRCEGGSSSDCERARGDESF